MAAAAAATARSVLMALSVSWQVYLSRYICHVQLRLLATTIAIEAVLAFLDVRNMILVMEVCRRTERLVALANMLTLAAATAFIYYWYAY